MVKGTIGAGQKHVKGCQIPKDSIWGLRRETRKGY